MCIRDSVAIGSDDDFIRMPMTAMTAQRIATLTGCILPTRKLVDDIHRHAKAKLPPCWIEGGPTLRHRLDYVKHHEDLEAQRSRKGYRLGELTAGDMKDIVLTNRLVDREQRVAIYGWHKENGEIIQPLSTAHGRRYADYSHGVRLVHGAMTIDGVEHEVSRVLQSAALCSTLSDEGPLRYVTYPLDWPVDPPEKTRRRRTARRP